MSKTPTAIPDLTKQGIKKAIAEQMAPSSKKKKVTVEEPTAPAPIRISKSVPSTPDESKQPSILPADQIKDIDWESKLKATKTQKDSKSFEIKQPKVLKIRDYLASFPDLEGVLKLRHPEVIKKPYGVPEEELDNALETIAREIKRPFTEDITKKIVLGLCKAIEKSGPLIGRNFTGGTLRAHRRLNDPRLSPLIKEIGIKWGVDKIPPEILLIYELYNIMDETEQENENIRKGLSKLENFDFEE